MLRMKEVEDDSLKQDLQHILSVANYLIGGMLEVARQKNKNFELRGSPKRLSARTANTIIAFSQNFVQGMWYEDHDDLMQLPHVDNERAKNFKKRYNAVSFEQYCRLTTNERRAMELYDDPQEFEDCERIIKRLPIIDVTCTFEEDVIVGDPITLKVQITHLNFDEEEQSLGFVHSNRFPYRKRSSWYMVLSDADDNKLYSMERLDI